MARHDGGCLCGAIRYRVTAPPLFSAVCHCRCCRRQTGSAFSLVTAFPEASFALSGQPRVHVERGESGGEVARHFCGDCGSPILSRLEVLPDIVIVKSGTLDDDAIAVPTIEVFCDGALGFLPAFAGTERHPRSNLAPLA